MNAPQLPKDNTRLPKIVRVGTTALSSSVVTTDFFGFDTSDNHYKLKGLGDVSEMGDAVLGLVAEDMGANAPRWLAIRNVSDPQIKADGLTHPAAGGDRRPDLQGLRPLELRLQRDHLLGQHRGGIAGPAMHASPSCLCCHPTSSPEPPSAECWRRSPSTTGCTRGRASTGRQCSPKISASDRAG